MIRSLFLAASIALAPALTACSCFGPQTFCGVLNPPYPNPEWWIPHTVILGVKLNSVAHGMDVRVIDNFSGEPHPEDTIRVWGDTGLLCRVYADAWAVGDTVVWGLMQTDQAGGSLEQPEDYMISVCGVYWLSYSNGIITGPLTEEGVDASIPIGEFQDFVDGCLFTGIQEEPESHGPVVRYENGGPWLSLERKGSTRLTVVDAMGRACLSRNWDGLPIQLSDIRPGAYLVQVRTEERMWIRKVVVD